MNVKPGDIVLINIPSVGNLIRTSAKKMYNRKISKVISVEDNEYCKLEIDGGKMSWPAEVLAVPVIKH